jgi:hypothetical protein
MVILRYLIAGPCYFFAWIFAKVGQGFADMGNWAIGPDRLKEWDKDE